MSHKSTIFIHHQKTKKSMGIIILPILLGSLVIGFYAIKGTIQGIRNKQINIKDLALGLLVSVAILFLIRANSESSYRYLTIMLYQSILPYAFYSLLRKVPSKIVRYCSKILLISIAISTILYSITILIGEGFI